MDNKSKELLVGLLKAGISDIPLVGGLLNEVCFEIRGRIAQKRVNDFTNSFIAYISELGLNIDENVMTSEEFNDIYISILKHVIETKCEHKLKIFREILKSNTINPCESNFKETFLELVKKLDYIEIEILKIYKDTGVEGNIGVPEGNDIFVSSRKSRSCKEVITENIKESNAELTALEIEGKYEFYICDLISKSLLIDTKTTGNIYGDLKKDAFTMLYITYFGKEFMKFIQADI
ncbi:hypothetical protein psyc5s11_30470 [Clostridium gelidum]|uniref:Uncharacterized protein n=1 Tax=Clostridium gelidum TaxID=704125 RepID=A0ABN6IXX2_9CLOT|nr:hypothetical protein [Clostridium gelidum]BCZ46980.1 hypothetical protein psyc5s11_30470 [Clostridium gelidum]